MMNGDALKEGFKFILNIFRSVSFVIILINKQVFP